MVKPAPFSKTSSTHITTVRHKNKLTINLQIVPHTTGEQAQAVKHLEYINKDDLIIYDRAYPAVLFYVLHQQKNVNFCARAKLDSSNPLKAFLCSGKKYFMGGLSIL